MRIRFLLATESMGLKLRRNIISANPQSNSPWMKPRCWRDCQRRRIIILQSIILTARLRRRNLVINSMLEDGKITAATGGRGAE